jgi:hypothetical protein
VTVWVRCDVISHNIPDLEHIQPHITRTETPNIQPLYVVVRLVCSRVSKRNDVDVQTIEYPDAVWMGSCRSVGTGWHDTSTIYFALA